MRGEQMMNSFHSVALLTIENATFINDDNNMIVYNFLYQKQWKKCVGQLTLVKIVLSPPHLKKGNAHDNVILLTVLTIPLTLRGHVYTVWNVQEDLTCGRMWPATNEMLCISMCFLRWPKIPMYSMTSQAREKSMTVDFYTHWVKCKTEAWSVKSAKRK